MLGPPRVRPGSPRGRRRTPLYAPFRHRLRTAAGRLHPGRWLGFSPSLGWALVEFEPYEVQDFVTVRRVDPPEQSDELVLSSFRSLHGLSEEFPDVHPEDAQNAEKRVKADLVLACLHPAQVRLLNADLGGQLGLGQASRLPELTDLDSNQKL